MTENSAKHLWLENGRIQQSWVFLFFSNECKKVPHIQEVLSICIHTFHLKQIEQDFFHTKYNVRAPR